MGRKGKRQESKKVNCANHTSKEKITNANGFCLITTRIGKFVATTGCSLQINAETATLLNQKKKGWLPKQVINNPFITTNLIVKRNAYELLAFLIYKSSAPVIEGALGSGASISRVNPASIMALAVVGPNAANRIPFC